MPRLIGYARVSTYEQTLDSQVKELTDAGCNEIFTDKMSGAKDERPGFNACMESLKEGDVLLVWHIDRLGRSVTHLVRIINELKEKKVGLKSILNGLIDTTTPSGNLVFNIFAVIAEFERGMIRERTLAGLAAARAQGKRGGRRVVQPDDPIVVQVRTLFNERKTTVREIAQTMNLCTATVYRYAHLGEPKRTKQERLISQVETARRQYEDKIKELEEKIRKLEREQQGTANDLQRTK